MERSSQTRCGRAGSTISATLLNIVLPSTTRWSCRSFAATENSEAERAPFVKIASTFSNMSSENAQSEVHRSTGSVFLDTSPDTMLLSAVLMSHTRYSSAEGGALLSRQGLILTPCIHTLLWLLQYA